VEQEKISCPRKELAVKGWAPAISTITL